MESKNVQTPDVEENFEDYKQIAQNQHSSYVYFKEQADEMRRRYDSLKEKYVK